MKKNTFLIIITCVTVVCILAGAYIHLCYQKPLIRSTGKTISRALRNGFRSVRNDIRDDFDQDFDDDFDEDFDNDFDVDIDSDSSDSNAQKFSSQLEIFDSIQIDANVMGVSIKRGNSYEISGSYVRNAFKPNYSVSGATLRITQPKYKNRLVPNGNCKIVITLPFGIQLDSINANVDVGAVELNGIDVLDIDIKTDVGAIAVNNVEFRELKADSDVGAVSVEVTQPLNEYNIDVKSDVGGIQVNNQNCKRKYSATGTTNKRIKVRTDVGGIDIK